MDEFDEGYQEGHEAGYDEGFKVGCAIYEKLIAAIQVAAGTQATGDMLLVRIRQLRSLDTPSENQP